MRECENLVGIDRRLTAVLAHQAEPAGTEELLNFATVCRLYRKRYPDAVRFYAAAFDADPTLAEHLDRHLRVNAARAAVLAAAGEGTAPPSPGDRPSFRKRALGWLRAE